MIKTHNYTVFSRTFPPNGNKEYMPRRCEWQLDRYLGQEGNRWPKAPILGNDCKLYKILIYLLL